MKQIMVIEAESNISLDNISVIEQEFSIILPKEYKQFLLIHNGGHPLKDCCPILEHIYDDTKHNKTDIAWFSAIHDGRYNNLAKDYRSFKGHRVPSELLTIAKNSGGDRICLSITGLSYGKIYFWDHENENPEDNKPWYKNVYLIAESFTDFINSLYISNVEFQPNSTKTQKFISTHDSYSLPYSPHVKKYGHNVLDFFKNAPSEVEDYIIEDIAATKDIVLYYDVKSENKRYIRRLSQQGEILEDKAENLS